MILTDTSGTISFLAGLVRTLQILPIQFDPASKSVHLVSAFGLQSFPRKLQCLIYTLLVILMGLQCYFKKGNSSMENAFDWISLAFMLTGLSYFLELQRKSSEIVLYINSLFQFDLEHPFAGRLRQMSLRTKGNIALVYGLIISCFIIPIGATYGLHWINPCKATLVGHWSLHECRHDDLVQKCHAACFVTKVMIFLLNHWMWSISLFAACFIACNVHILSMIAIQQFLQRYC